MNNRRFPFFDRTNRVLCFTICFILSLVPGNVNAFEQDMNAQPVVAVVLAGGGALGFAHVGALKVMEELGLQPDIVVGTSIGSIVGGLYSVGYTVRELENIIVETDWQAVLFDAPNRKELSFEQKTQQSEYYLRIPQTRNKNVTNIGLSHAQYVVEYLDELFSGYPFELDFDLLPRRFRAVAADLATGERVVYGEGDLKTVIRASMGIPGIFTPIEYRGRVVIDGGWADNIPATVAKELGADIVITVTLEQMTDNLSDLSTIAAIGRQAQLINTLDRIERSLEYTDVLIQPDLTGYTVADFEKGTELIDLGYAAALEIKSQLAAIASLQSGKTSPSESTVRDREIRISSVSVNQGKGDLLGLISEDDIKSKLGDLTTPELLRQQIYGYYDGGDFQHVWYRLKDIGYGNYNLEIDAPARLQPDSQISFALDFEGQYIGNAFAAVSLKAAYRHWFGSEKNLSLFSDLWLSEYPSIHLGMRFHPFGGNFSMDMNGYITQVQQYFYDGESIEALYVQQNFGGIFQLHQPLFKRFELTLGVLGEHSRVIHRTDVERFPEENWNRYALLAAVAIDTLDRVVTPTNGIRLDILFDESIDNTWTSDSQLKVAGDFYVPVKKRFVINPWLEAHILLDGSLSAVQSPTLGAIFLIHGFFPQEIRNENVAALGLQLRFQVASLPLGLGDEVYLQVASNYATAWDNAITENVRQQDHFGGGSLAVVAKTLLGELQLAVGMSNQRRVSMYLGLRTTRTFF